MTGDDGMSGFWARLLKTNNTGGRGMLGNLTEGASFVQGELGPGLTRNTWQDSVLPLALEALSLGTLGA